jgi:NAD(P)-dependent dehydrogenase (short-subunit alcohol dehydrogenase family)
MDLFLDGKTAIVTGGSKGIGAGVAQGLAAEGCAVHIVSRTLVDLEKTAARISEDTGVTVTPHATDLSNSANIDDMLNLIGTPDILVNNAGAIPAGNLQDINEDRWREAWDLKVFGYINMCRAFYAAMKERGHGTIINVTGLAAERTDANYVAGTTGNAGLNAFTRAVGGKSLNDGVRILSVSPGPVETERLVALMKTRAEAEFGDPDRWQSYLANLPLGRAASVQEVADVVVFMASKRASFVNGSVVTVDGGHGANQSSFN